MSDDTKDNDPPTANDEALDDLERPDAVPSDDSNAEDADGEAEDGARARAARELSDDALLELCRRAEERDAYRDEALRARAELDNHIKRVRRDRPQWQAQAVRGFVEAILPVLDNFELALLTPAGDEKTLRQGVEMIYQLLRGALDDAGVEEIVALDQPFDPEVHEAIAAQEVTEGEDNRVLDVQQKGFKYAGQVIRPSRVRVAKLVDR